MAISCKGQYTHRYYFKHLIPLFGPLSVLCVGVGVGGVVLCRCVYVCDLLIFFLFFFQADFFSSHCTSPPASTHTPNDSRRLLPLFGPLFFCQADFFFIPLHLSVGYYTHRYYFKHFTAMSARPTRAALAYVRKTWPFFDRKNGADHLMVMSQDQGNRFVRQQVWFEYEQPTWAIRVAKKTIPNLDASWPI